jgi:hypothetical protein
MHEMMTVAMLVALTEVAWDMSKRQTRFRDGGRCRRVGGLEPWEVTRSLVTQLQVTSACRFPREHHRKLTVLR